MASSHISARGGPLDGGRVRYRGEWLATEGGAYRVLDGVYEFLGPRSRRCEGCRAWLVPEPEEALGACPLCGQPPPPSAAG